MGTVLVAPTRAQAQFEAPKTVEELENEPVRPRGKKAKPKAEPTDDPNEGLPTDTGPDPEDELPSRPRSPVEVERPGRPESVPDPAAVPRGVKGRPEGRDAGPVAARDAGAALLAEGPPDAGAVLPIELPRDSIASLLETWDGRRKAVLGHNPKAQAEAEQLLVRQREALGIRDLESMSGAMDHEALRRLDAKDPVEANRLADLGVTLSPDVPSPRFALARVRLASDLGNVGDALSALREGISRTARQPTARLATLGNLAAALGIGMALAAAVALLVLALRPVRYAVHDFHHLFPRGALPAQTAVLFVLVAMLPWALKLGPVAELTALCCASFLYLRPGERAVATILVVLLAALPTLAGLGAREAIYPGSLCARIEQVEQGGPDAQGAVAQLEALEHAGQADSAVLFALGLDAKRNGHYDRSIELFRHALALSPKLAEAENDLANALLLKGDLDHALDSYLRASELAPDSAVVAYNLAKVSTRRAQLLNGHRDVSNDIERGKSATSAVYRLDRGLMDRPTDNRANLYVLDLELPDAAVALPDGKPVEAALTSQLRAVLWGNSPELSMGLAALLLLVFWGLSLATARVKPCSECSRCGRAVCARCDREVAGGSLCGQCFNAFMKKGAVDSAARLAKEASARRYQERWVRARRVGSYALAGLGHLLTGRPVTGLLFLLLGATGAAAVGLGEGLFRAPYGGSMAGARMLLGGALLVLAWALSIRSYRADERRG
jgi:tetratricopeptide (TPR) repeat protein